MRSCEERFSGAAMLVEAAGDVRDLVRHVRENAAAYGIDADRIALWAGQVVGAGEEAQERARHEALEE
jgi:hypothetical protein